MSFGGVDRITLAAVAGGAAEALDRVVLQGLGRVGAERLVRLLEALPVDSLVTGDAAVGAAQIRRGAEMVLGILRPHFADGVVVAKGVDRCLSVYTPDGFEKFVDAQLGSLSPFSRQARAMSRHLYAGAWETELDRQLRGDLLRALGTLGNDEEVQARARTVYARYREDEGSVEANVLPAVIAILAASGGEAEYAEFRDRFARARTPQEEQRYLYALAGFRRHREETLALLNSLSAEQWLRGGIHSQRGRLALGDWVASLAAHDDNHLDQLRRALAGRP